MTQTRSEIQGLLARHGITPRRRIGQHFLADPNIVAKIVRLSGDPVGVRALEIGVGTGTLTRALVEAGFEVTAYEIDERLRPLIAEALDGLEVDLRFGDAAELDLAELGSGTSWALVANLPYYSGASMLLDLLRKAAGLSRCVVMVQSEVARRLTAAPGSKIYGLPSVVAALYGRARMGFPVPPQVFLPRPNVDSAVIVIDRTAGPGPQRDLAVELAAAGFRRRRKMLRSALRPVVPEPVGDRLEQAGIDPSRRAESLAADDFLAIAGVVRGG